MSEVFLERAQFSWMVDLFRLGALQSQENLKQVRHQILEHTVRGFGATSGTLALTNDDGASLSIVAGIQLPAHLLGQVIPYGKGILGSVAAQGESLLLSGDVSKDPHYAGLVGPREGARPSSALCWPLRVDSRVIGVMSLNRSAEERPFTERDVEEGAPIINLMTLVIENARLHANQQHQIQELHRLNAQKELFHKARNSLFAAAQDLLHTGDYGRFYGCIVEDVMRITGACYGAFALFDAGGKMVDFITRGVSDEVIQAIGHLPEGKGLLRGIYRDKTPVRVDDIASDPSSCGFPPGHPSMRSLLGLPMLSDGKTRGIVYLAEKEGGEPFTDGDLTLLEVYCNEALHVLERQDLLTQLRQDDVERQAAEEKLSKVKTRLQSLIANSPAVIYTANPADHSPTFVSENIERIIGYSPAVFVGDAQSWISRVHPEDVPGIITELSGLKDQRELVLEFRFRSPNGTYRWIRNNLRLVCNDAGDPEEILGVVTDVTELKAAEEELRQQQKVLLETNKRLEESHSQLLQSEKMAAIGQLAAGVAHEINNPIGYINSNIGTLQGYIQDLFRLLDAYDRMEPAAAETDRALMQVRVVKQEIDLAFLKHDITDLLRESQEGVSRVRQIVRDLKDFSHVDDQEWTWADLRQGLDSTLNIVHNEIKYKAKVIKEYGDIPQIECRLHQLNQVFMNLLVNAAHAIEDKGTIWVRTGTEQDWVWVEIEDTGHGIAPEHLTRIFDPFFTTKPVGKGTGLGLSLSWGIVQRHGGRIEVDNAVGKGARFRVWLPLRRTAEAA